MQYQRPQRFIDLGLLSSTGGPGQLKIFWVNNAQKKSYPSLFPSHSALYLIRN